MAEPTGKGNIAKLAESIADRFVSGVESVGEKIHDLVLGSDSENEHKIEIAPPQPSVYTIGDTSHVPLILQYPMVSDPKLLMGLQQPTHLSLNPEQALSKMHHSKKEFILPDLGPIKTFSS